MDENSHFENNPIFGYTFPNNPNSQPADTNPQPPTGPPLLEDREHQLLTQFFNNPDNNHFDPSLFSLQTDQYNEGNGFFGNFGPAWMSNQNDRFLSRTGPGQSQGQFASQPSNDRRFNYDAFVGGEEHLMEGEPSQDVYAAARLLHDQQASHAHNHSQDDHERYNGMVFAKKNCQQHPAHDAPGVTSPLPSFLYASTPYFFAATGASKSLSAHADASTYPDPSQIHGDESHAALQSQSGLNFGSDKEFQTDNYIATGRNYTDPHMDEYAQYAAMALLKPEGTNAEDQPASAGDQSRKRRRLSIKTSEASSGEDQGDGNETGVPQPKRVSYAAKDYEQDRESSSAKGRAGKRYSKTPSQPSPGKRGKPSSPDAKPQRENLSEEQKRSNHILSEQKRRNVIKQGFEDINRMVPELRTGGFSRSNMLLEAAKFMRELKKGNEQLRQHFDSLDESQHDAD